MLCKILKVYCVMQVFLLVWARVVVTQIGTCYLSNGFVNWISIMFLWSVLI
jgi:hypothetical protein